MEIFLHQPPENMWRQGVGTATGGGGQPLGKLSRIQPQI